ncbi:MAG: (Fe-S)-binding protein [Firmicutes bacterium]|nr:(Fe-S)-binding protein [Bacillota bacterium]
MVSPLDQCVHCGLCLSSCPTYLETGLEMESPRGRLVLLNLWAQAPEQRDAAISQWLDDCLDCRACEAVCPAHVPTGHLVEAWRGESEDAPRPGRAQRLLMRLIENPRGLKWLQRLGRWSQTRVGRSLVRWWLTGREDSPLRLQQGLPPLQSRRLSREQITSNHRGPGDLWLFVGCVMDAIYAGTNRHAADLLRLAGLTVVVDPRQRCCGALHWHNGQRAQAQQWAQENIEAFESSGCRMVVVDAAGCLTALREYPVLLAGTPYEARAHAFSQAVFDALEVLSQHPLPPLPDQGLTVTVHDACHHVHAQGIRHQPRFLLERAGYRLVEMANASQCCGSAGIYNLAHPDMSRALLAAKVRAIPPQAEVVSAANPGCLLHIQQGLAASGTPVTAQHPLDLLWHAYRSQGYLPGGGARE